MRETLLFRCAFFAAWGFRSARFLQQNGVFGSGTTCPWQINTAILSKSIRVRSSRSFIVATYLVHLSPTFPWLKKRLREARNWYFFRRPFGREGTHHQLDISHWGHNERFHHDPDQSLSQSTAGSFRNKKVFDHCWSWRTTVYHGFSILYVCIHLPFLICWLVAHNFLRVDIPVATRNVFEIEVGGSWKFHFSVKQAKIGPSSHGAEKGRRNFHDGLFLVGGSPCLSSKS